jgi:hypothetical protein
MDEELVRVEFRGPVWVHINVDRGEVVSVHVGDTAVEGSVGFSTYSGGAVDTAARRVAAELTVDDTSWPSWTIGFDHT